MIIIIEEISDFYQPAAAAAGLRVTTPFVVQG